MTQPARLSTPATSPIDRYVVNTLDQLDRAIADLVLTAPITRDVDLAARTIDRLIETLAGLAIGSVVGAVLAGVRRTFDREVRARVERATAHSIRDLGSPAIAPLHGLDAALVRSLGFESRQRLRRRNALAGSDVRRVIGAIATVIDERHAFERMLGVIAVDSTLAYRYTELAVEGWSAATAVIEGRIGEASAAVWGQWAARMAGRRTEELPTQQQLAAAGFVMRIG